MTPSLRLLIANGSTSGKPSGSPPGVDHHVPTDRDPTPTRAERHYAIQVMLFRGR
jgi:hypothetical protein